MSAKFKSILQLQLLVALLVYYAAAYVPCTVLRRSGPGAENLSQVIGSTEVTKGGGPGAENLSQVIGSTEVTKGTTPWVVSIQTTKYSTRMHVCGGVIVDYEWILTTAHCVEGENIDTLLVVAGDHNLDDCDGDESLRKVNLKIIHSEYDSFSRNNDIALLHLRHKYWKSQTIKPIAFFRNPVSYIGETCKIFGWGASTLDGNMPEVLMQANQTVFGEKDCKDVFSNLIEDSMLCAADLQTGAGPCHGDWGGPLVCRSDELCGLASWGAGCGSNTLPAVYTNATYFYDWVDSIVNLRSHDFHL